MATLEEKIRLINESFDERGERLEEERKNAIAKAVVDDAAENLGSMSMGNIITIFENVSSEVLKTRGGKKRINDFLSLVKEDKNIHNSYLMKESVFSNASVGNPKDVIEECLSIAAETNDRKSFNTSKKNLAKFVAESMSGVNPSVISEKVKLDEETRRVNDNLETIMWGRKSIQNAIERTRSINETVDFMSRQKNDAVSKESEFEECKNECIKTIDEAWEHSDVNIRLKLTEVKEKLSKKAYSELTADDDIKYMKELIDTVK